MNEQYHETQLLERITGRSNPEALSREEAELHAAFFAFGSALDAQADSKNNSFVRVAHRETIWDRVMQFSVPAATIALVVLCTFRFSHFTAPRQAGSIAASSAVIQRAWLEENDDWDTRVSSFEHAADWARFSRTSLIQEELTAAAITAEMSEVRSEMIAESM